MLVQYVLASVFLLLLLRILQQRTAGRLFKISSSAVILAALYIVLFPDVTNRVARFAGVGRGADLTIYISMAAGGYLLTICYMRLKDTELRIARLVQHFAIEAHRFEVSTTRQDSGRAN